MRAHTGTIASPVATPLARASLLVVALCALMIAGGAPAAYASGDPVARVDWSVPARTVDGNGDGFIDRYFSCDGALPAGTLTTTDSCSSVADVQPSSWNVVLDACASTPGDLATITGYRYSILETGATRSGSACRAALTVPEQGAYTVETTVSDSSGASATTTTAIVVRDILFASLGDSYGSGEGNPPFFDGGCLSGIGQSCGSSQSTRCDRSTQAAAAQAALRMEESSDETSVTFIHLACSGAEIIDSTPNDDTADGGLLDPYEGVVPIERSDGTKDVIPPQVDYLAALVGPRKIDFLHLSVGGNDMGFADIISSCIDLSFLVSPLLWLALPNCYVDVIGAGGIAAGFEPAVRIFNHGISKLPEHYVQLNEALKSKLSYASDEIDASGAPVPVLSPERVYITEYPDPTRGDDGDWCGWPSKPTDLPGFTYKEFKWASTTVAPSLNEVVKSSAEGFRWNYIGGISAPYATHGYCASDHWVVNLTESFGIQGDKNATFHPNIRGQNVARDRIAGRLLTDLRNPPTPPTIELYPTALVFSANTAGANGWHTGECATFGGACDRDDVHYTVVVRDNNGIKGPVDTSLTLAVDGQPVTLSDSASGISCTPADLADACDLFPDPGTNPKAATFVIKFTGGGAHSLDITALNVRGRTSSAHFDVKVDRSPPTLSTAQITSGTPGNQGWYVSPVDLRFSASDAFPGSGLDRIETLLLGEGPAGEHLALPTTGDPTAGPIAATVTTEGDHLVGYEAVDGAELRSGDPLTVDPPGRSTLRVKIDTRPPAVSGAADRAPDSRDWYNHDVTVHFSATDPAPGSGVDPASVTPAVILAEGANQSVAGSAADIAGHGVSTTVGPISIDETTPAAAITGASDGSFSYGASDLLSGTVLTNAPSLAVSYTASDGLSGLHQVRLDAASATAPSGSLITGLNPGISTHTLVVEDVAGNTTAIPFSVLRVVPSSVPDPRGAGFWQTAVQNGAYTTGTFAALLNQADMASRSFGTPDNRYPDATLANAGELLQTRPASDPDGRVRRELLAAWLNLVSGREAATRMVNLRSISGWQTIVTNTGGSPSTTALNLLRQAEARLNGAATKIQLETIKSLLEAFNGGQLSKSK